MIKLLLVDKLILKLGLPGPILRSDSEILLRARIVEGED